MNDARRSAGIALVNSIMRVRSFSERCFFSSAKKSSIGIAVASLPRNQLYFAPEIELAQTTSEPRNIAARYDGSLRLPQLLRTLRIGPHPSREAFSRSTNLPVRQHCQKGPRLELSRQNLAWLPVQRPSRPAPEAHRQNCGCRQRPLKREPARCRSVVEVEARSGRRQALQTAPRRGARSPTA